MGPGVVELTGLREDRVKSLLALPLIIALASLLAPPVAAAPLTIAVSRGSVSLPIYVAAEENLFKAEGLDVLLSPCSSGRACFANLLDRKADVATAAELVVVLNQREPVVALATISASSHQIKLIARRSAGIGAPEDLRGRKLGTAMGTSSHYFLDSLLLFHGIETAEVGIADHSPEQLSDALSEGRLDGIAIWEPLATRTLQRLGADGLTLPSPRIYTQHFNVIVRQDDLGRRGDDLRRLLRALVRAEALIARDPQRARQLLARQFELGPTEAAALFKEQDYRVRLDQSLASTMNAQLRWARGLGLLRRDSEVRELVAAEPLRAVAPTAVTLVKP